VGEIKFEENDYITSIDVESLFTNLPLGETNKIIKDAYSKEKIEKVSRIKENIGNKSSKRTLYQY
jgi:hypothetical protein